ncbi:hypothetical protein ES705_49736 [subsurface metagenome]
MGIGTNSPGTKLHVARTLEVLRIQGTVNPAIHFYSDVGRQGFIRFATTLNEIDIFHELTGGSIVFGTVGAPRMKIDSSGNVGIGTLDPKSKLHVVGLPIYVNNAAAITGGLTAGAFYRTGADPDPVCVVH